MGSLFLADEIKDINKTMGIHAADTDIPAKLTAMMMYEQCF